MDRAAAPSAERIRTQRATEFAAALVVAVRDGPERSPEACAAVGALLRSERRQHGFAGPRKRWRWPWVTAIVLVAASPIAIVLSVMHYPPMGAVVGVQVAAVLWAIAGVFCVYGLWWRDPTKIAGKVIINPNCPRCGYDLRGTATMIHPSRLGGAWIGPERCPECGVEWPLVPWTLGGAMPEESSLMTGCASRIGK